MKNRIFDEPLEDEATESLAWQYYETAKEQGSLLSDDELIKECRELAQKDMERRSVMDDIPIEEDDEQ